MLSIKEKRQNGDEKKLALQYYSQLPPEIWVEILKFLNPRKWHELTQLSHELTQLSKKFKKIYPSNMLWACTLLEQWQDKKPKNSYGTENMGTYISGVKKRKIPYCPYDRPGVHYYLNNMEKPEYGSTVHYRDANGVKKDLSAGPSELQKILISSERVRNKIIKGETTLEKALEELEKCLAHHPTLNEFQKKGIAAGFTIEEVKLPNFNLCNDNILCTNLSGKQIGSLTEEQVEKLNELDVSEVKRLREIYEIGEFYLKKHASFDEKLREYVKHHPLTTATTLLGIIMTMGTTAVSVVASPLGGLGALLLFSPFMKYLSDLNLPQELFEAIFKVGTATSFIAGMVPAATLPPASVASLFFLLFLCCNCAENKKHNHNEQNKGKKSSENHVKNNGKNLEKSNKQDETEEKNEIKERDETIYSSNNIYTLTYTSQQKEPSTSNSEKKENKDKNINEIKIKLTL